MILIVLIQDCQGQTGAARCLKLRTQRAVEVVTRPRPWSQVAKMRWAGALCGVGGNARVGGAEPLGGMVSDSQNGCGIIAEQQTGPLDDHFSARSQELAKLPRVRCSIGRSSLCDWSQRVRKIKYVGRIAVPAGHSKTRRGASTCHHSTWGYFQGTLPGCKERTGHRGCSRTVRKRNRADLEIQYRNHTAGPRLSPAHPSIREGMEEQLDGHGKA